MGACAGGAVHRRADEDLARAAAKRLVDRAVGHTRAQTPQNRPGLSSDARNRSLPPLAKIAEHKRKPLRAQSPGPRSESSEGSGEHAGGDASPPPSLRSATPDSAAASVARNGRRRRPADGKQRPWCSRPPRPSSACAWPPLSKTAPTPKRLSPLFDGYSSSFGIASRGRVP